MTYRRFTIGVGYGGMILFFMIPLLKVLQDDPFSIPLTLLSIAIAVVFGIFATVQCMKYEEERDKRNNSAYSVRLQKKLAKKEKLRKMIDELEESSLKMPCPSCGKKLMELTSNKGNFVLGSYKGLVYCTVCDYEESKDEFDRMYP